MTVYDYDDIKTNQKYQGNVFIACKTKKHSIIVI